jgi:hypothetical protein
MSSTIPPKERLSIMELSWVELRQINFYGNETGIASFIDL